MRQIAYIDLRFYFCHSLEGVKPLGRLKIWIFGQTLTGHAAEEPAILNCGGKCALSWAILLRLPPCWVMDLL
jgi:hypothetical protein